MSIETFTSREFNQDVTAAKKAALHSPVQITDRGRVSHVLLSIDEYNRVTHSREDIVELLAMPEEPMIEFEPQQLSSKLFKAADLD